MGNGWIGVDLDGTLAKYNGWIAADYIGPPIPKMVDRIRNWVTNGQEIRIFTSRVSPISAKHNDIKVERIREIIEEWLIDVFGFSLPITHEKDFAMVALYDDMSLYQIQKNTGEIIKKRLIKYPVRAKINETTKK